MKKISADVLKLPENLLENIFNKLKKAFLEAVRDNKLGELYYVTEVNISKFKFDYYGFTTKDFVNMHQRLFGHNNLSIRLINDNEEKNGTRFIFSRSGPKIIIAQISTIKTSINDYLFLIHSSLEHELRHYIQSILDIGIPKNKLNNIANDPKKMTLKDYISTDREYETNIGDCAKTFINLFREFSKETKLKLVKFICSAKLSKVINFLIKEKLTNVIMKKHSLTEKILFNRIKFITNIFKNLWALRRRNPKYLDRFKSAVKKFASKVLI